MDTMDVDELLDESDVDVDLEASLYAKLYHRDLDLAATADSVQIQETKNGELDTNRKRVPDERGSGNGVSTAADWTFFGATFDDEDEDSDVQVICQVPQLEINSNVDGLHAGQKRRQTRNSREELEELFSHVPRSEWTATFTIDEIQDYLGRSMEDWSVCDDDRTRYASKLFGGRYYGSRKESLLQCRRCREYGHKQRNCTTKIKQVCPYCAEEHHPMKCRDSRFCILCFQSWHRADDCRQQGVPHCGRCNDDGHMAQACPEQWRQFHSTTSSSGQLGNHGLLPDVSSRSRQVYCYNCGRSGHLGRECRKSTNYDGKLVCFNPLISLQRHSTNIGTGELPPIEPVTIDDHFLKQQLEKVEEWRRIKISNMEKHMSRQRKQTNRQKLEPMLERLKSTPFISMDGTRRSQTVNHTLMALRKEQQLVIRRLCNKERRTQKRLESFKEQLGKAEGVHGEKLAKKISCEEKKLVNYSDSLHRLQQCLIDNGSNNPINTSKSLRRLRIKERRIEKTLASSMAQLDKNTMNAKKRKKLIKLIKRLEDRLEELRQRKTNLRGNSLNDDVDRTNGRSAGRENFDKMMKKNGENTRAVKKCENMDAADSSIAERVRARHLSTGVGGLSLEQKGKKRSSRRNRRHESGLINCVQQSQLVQQVSMDVSRTGGMDSGPADEDHVGKADTLKRPLDDGEDEPSNSGKEKRQRVVSPSSTIGGRVKTRRRGSSSCEDVKNGELAGVVKDDAVEFLQRKRDFLAW